MPVEHIRKRFAQDPSLYPELAPSGPSRKSQEAIPKKSVTSSAASTTSSQPSSAATSTRSSFRLPAKHTGAKRSTVIISSSDEEDGPEIHEISSDDSDIVEITPEPQTLPNSQRVENYRPSSAVPDPARSGAKSTEPRKPTYPIFTRPQTTPMTPFNGHNNPETGKPPIKPSAIQARFDESFFGPPRKMPTGPATPIHIPSNRDLAPNGFAPRAIPPSLFQTNADGEDVAIPDFREDNIYMSPADAEKALRDLMSGGMNQDLDTAVDIDMSQAVVDGFRDGITLLPHQVLGRVWMRDREDLSKKRTGGILADDMGLGKTIQTLTRIVEGRATKVDKADGWSASTLVVCPLALVGQWADEVTKMTGLRVLKHQGTSRTTDPNAMQKYHVVITTYDTIKSEYMAFSPAKDESKSKASSKKVSLDDSDEESGEEFGRTIKKPAGKGKAPVKKCALFGVKWWRVVLDEAHNIKNKATKGAIACCELQSKFRWCLTGTPMQNNVTELYSLIKFLRIKPLSNWDTFNEQIAKPVNSGRGASRAMKRLQVVLKQIMLRRRKDQTLNGKALIDLPKRIVKVVPCDFDGSERTFYESLETKMEDVIAKLMSTKNNNQYISVLLLLLRLRQACNHPILVSDDYKQDSEALEPKSVPKGGDDKDADADDDLIAAFGQLGVTKKCQMCTLELKPGNTGTGEWNTHCLDCVPLAIQSRDAKAERPTSAKIRMILRLLQDIKERSNGQEKAIIFSQFTSMLSLIEPFLKEKGIEYVRYDGSMNAKDREVALNIIKTSTTTKIILISFKAGSTGLNLTACNNVILVDLWWNPALEDQAFDRAHRFGQTRDVNIYKLKIDGTVEDRILLLQEKKRALAAAALSGDKLKNMRLGMDELLALFRPGGRDDDEESD